jgi:hypothetical protein
VLYCRQQLHRFYHPEHDIVVVIVTVHTQYPTYNVCYTLRRCFTAAVAAAAVAAAGPDQAYSQCAERIMWILLCG